MHMSFFFLNMNRDSLHTIRFRHIHLSGFKYRLTKMALPAQKVYVQQCIELAMLHEV